MSNEITAAILNYAEIHPDFGIEDLFTHLHTKIGISRSSLSWYLFKFVDDNALVRTGRGMYGKVVKQSFSPKPTDEVKKVYELLQANFLFTSFCVYQGEIISPLQHCLSFNRIIYVKTEREIPSNSHR